MTVEDGAIVDAIGVERATGNVVLTIVDHLDWENEREHLETLQEKVNCYLAFIESGELVTKYPNAAGRNACIDVVFRVEPSDEAVRFLQIAHETVESAKVGFRWRTLIDAS